MDTQTTPPSYGPPPDDYDMIFVFGSNERGVHGAGAAAYAAKYHGAQWGVGEGPTGRCYALPTKDRHIETRSLNAIIHSVGKFLLHAKSNPEQKFQLTALGCGLAGLSVSTVAPLFAMAPENVLLPPEFREDLPALSDDRFWK